MPPLPLADETAEAGQSPPGSPGELFLVFAGISLQAFGGALSFMERAVVRDKRWLGPSEFLGLYAVSQVLPGPTGISFCVLLGDRFFGLRGAIATLAGFLLPPALVVLVIASVFQQFQHIPQVQGALHGMGAVAVGLIITTAMRMARTLHGQRVGMVVAALSFSAVGLARLHVSTVVLTLGVLSVLWAWRSLGR
jgi:chromate transporter